MTEVQIKPMQSKSMDWFLYDRDLCYERVNIEIIIRKSKKQEVKLPGANAHSSCFIFESHDAISLWIISQNLHILKNRVYMFHRIRLNSRINFRSSHRKCSVKKGVLKRFTKLQENTYPRVSFLIKLQPLTQVLFYEFCEISKNTFSTEHLGTTASVTQ